MGKTGPGAVPGLFCARTINIFRFRFGFIAFSITFDKIVTMTKSEKQAAALLRKVDPQTTWGFIIHAALSKTSIGNFRELLKTLLSQWEDNPNAMRKILGFDLPSIFGMKKFSVESINEEMAAGLLSFRAVEEVTVTAPAQWVAEAGSFIYPGVNGFIYVDSTFNRYVRLGNGQMFRCTNTDLTSMSDSQKHVLFSYFIGLID